MNLYYAPLEGLTDAIYRRVHHALFPGLDKYFMPFVSPSRALSFTSRQLADISPAENAGVPAVPQVLASNADYFLDMVKALENAGYAEVNLNLGCPSGTVTAKGKGAGMLKDVHALERFLDRVYAFSALPVSLKTRAGFASAEEFDALLRLFIRYPVREWILHPRTGLEAYLACPHRELYEEAKKNAPFPVIYNGGIFTKSDFDAFKDACPEADGAALGRGLAVNPALGRELRGGEPLTLRDLSAFHDRLYYEYLKSWPEHAVVGRMHGVMHYLIQALSCPPPLVRALRKSTGVSEYADAVVRVFRESELKPVIRFTFPSQEGL